MWTVCTLYTMLQVRRVATLDYDVAWVDLLEMDGVAPYSYSEVCSMCITCSMHAPDPDPNPNPNFILTLTLTLTLTSS